MTAELLIYIALCGVSLFFCFLSKQRALVLFTFFSVLIYLWVVRKSGFDSDFKTYALTLHYLPEFSATSTYYLREFVYWFGSAYLFRLAGSEVLTFWIIDSLWVGLLIYSLANPKPGIYLPLYLMPFMIVFFPVLMGYENVYRQLIASVLVVYAFVGAKRVVSAMIAGFLALFVHNAVVVFMPLLYLLAGRGRSSGAGSRIGFTVLYVLMICGVYYVSIAETQLGKSSTTSGMPLTFAYLVLFGLMVFASLILSRLNLKILIKKNIPLVYSFVTLIFVIPVLGDAQSERIGMMMLILAVIFFAADLESRFRQQQRPIARAAFVAIGVLPAFLFNSAFVFLTSTVQNP